MPLIKHVKTVDIVRDYKKRGQGVAEIAERRHLSTSTVNYHLAKAGVQLDGKDRKKRKDAGLPKIHRAFEKHRAGKNGFVDIRVTEERLDRWWASLELEEKGKVFELGL